MEANSSFDMANASGSLGRFFRKTIAFVTFMCKSRQIKRRPFACLSRGLGMFIHDRIRNTCAQLRINTVVNISPKLGRNLNLGTVLGVHSLLHTYTSRTERRVITAGLTSRDGNRIRRPENGKSRYVFGTCASRKTCNLWNRGEKFRG